jgi:signal transduction histidine kinase
MPLRPDRSPSPLLVDGVIAAGLAAAGELEAAGDLPGARGAVAWAVPAMMAALAWRRRAPALAFAGVYGAYAAQALAGGHGEQSIAVSLALLLAVYSLAAHAADGRIAVLALLPAQAIAWLALALEGRRDAGDYLFSLLLGGGAWVGGYAVRSNRLVAARHERRATDVEARSAAEREHAVAAERARIAREIHDVVAHTMSVLVVQTGAARQLVRSQPERSEELMRSTEAIGRQALSEMRRLLGLIRHDAAGLGVAPQPGLGQLGELVARGRAAGLDLRVRPEGEPRALPAGVDLAAYRIVQEAITNAIKHGHGPATLSVRYRSGALELELRNALPARPRAAGGAGHGLIGMRERATLYGGTLEAGASGCDEFAVRAVLPLDAGTA